MDKHPIGANPSWFVLKSRIQDLSSAIGRYTGHERFQKDKDVTRLIRIWATEIIGTCNTIDKIIDVEKQ